MHHTIRQSFVTGPPAIVMGDTMTPWCGIRDIRHHGKDESYTLVGFTAGVITQVRYMACESLAKFSGT